MREAVEDSLAVLCRQFPDVPRDVIISLFADSYRLVIDVTGQPLVSKGEELTRLRLELRTRHPAYEASRRTATA